MQKSDHIRRMNRRMLILTAALAPVLAAPRIALGRSSFAT